MPGAPTVFASRVVDLQPILDAAGIGFDATVRELGMVPDQLSAPSARVPHAGYAELWRRLDRVDDGLAGIRHAQQQLRIQSLDVVGFGVQTAATLRDALEFFVRSYLLINPLAINTIEQHGTDLIVTDTPLPHGAQHAWSRARAEHALGAYLFLGRQLAAQGLRATAVRFQHHRTTGAAALSEILAAPVTFGAPANQIVFSRESMRAPVRTCDAAIHRYFATIVERLVQEGDHGNAMSVRVQQLVLAGLRSGAGLLEVAQKLGMSPRTLQRRLDTEGTSFIQLADAVRKRRAEWLVGATSLPLKRVQAELGFGDDKSFRRAFARWTGTTPARFRRR